MKLDLVARLLTTTCGLAWWFLPCSALAQLPVDPPTNILTDENGVDLSTGTLDYQLVHQLPSISPGLPPYTRYWLGSGWRDTLTMTIKTGSPSSGYTSATVQIGAESDSFSSTNGTTFTSTAPKGSSLSRDASTNTFTYRDTAGTIYVFDLNGYWSGASGSGTTAPVTSIKFPSGETVTFTNQKYTSCGSPCLYPQVHWRLQDVSSSSGFSYKLEYASEDQLNAQQWLRRVKITRYNRAAEYCDPAASSCAFSLPWPYIQYSETQVGTQWTETETDATARTAQFVRLTRNKLISARRASSSVDNMTVTWNNDVVGQIVRDGRTWTYTFSPACCSATMTTTVGRPTGGSMVVVSDQNLHVPSSIQDELGRTTTFVFDAYQHLTSVTYPSGTSLQYTYDARGNRTSRSVVSSTPGNPPNMTTTWSYVGVCTNPVTCNRPISMVDPRNNATDYTYDPNHGGVLTETRPAPTIGAVRPQRRYQYTQYQAYFKNASGSIVASGVPTYLPTTISECRTAASCAGTSDELLSKTDYGPQTPGVANNLLIASETKAAGDNSLTATSAYTYDNNGWRLTVDGPLSGNADTTRYRYDAAGRMVGQIGPDPDGALALPNRAVRTTYDPDGQPTLIEQGVTNGQSDTAWQGFSSLVQYATSYDGAGRKAQDSVAGGGATYALTQYSYDAAGRPECTAVRMNPAAFSSLPASACSLGAAGAFGPDRITRRVSNTASELTQVRAAVGTASESAQLSLGYTVDGKLLTVTDGENNLTTYAYDGLGRRTTTYFPVPAKGASTSNGSDFEQLTLDANGNVTGRRLRDGNLIGYTYDALNRMTVRSLPASEPSASYSYDNLDNLTGASQTGNNISFGYDGLARRTAETGPQGTIRFGYDPAGRRIQISWSDGLFVNYDYLVTNEISAIRENGVGVLASYGYDNLGRRTSVQRGDGTSTSYGYDAVSRLSSLSENLAGTIYDQASSYAYNPASQIIQTQRSNPVYAGNPGGSGATNSTANGLNQLTSVGSVTPAYDGRGNMTYAGGLAYGYSSENLLKSTSGGASLTYDPFKRLYQISGGSNGTQRFSYDAMNLAAEYDGSGALLRRYVYGPGFDEPIVSYEGSGTGNRRFLHSDERGSVFAVTDGSGNILTANTYDEFGRPGASNGGRFMFTGQAYIPELGLYYYKKRMYASGLGRFMQTDPIGYGDGPNWYIYAHDDPINLIDPMGEGICIGEKSDGTCQLILVTGRRTKKEVTRAQGPRNGIGPRQDKSRQGQNLPCDNPKAFAHSGRVQFTGVTAGGAILVGAALYHGGFQTESGIKGTFTSIEFLAGFRGEYGLVTGFSKNLSTFVGGNDTMAAGYNLAGMSDDASVAKDLDGREVGLSTSVSGSSVNVSYTGGFSNTDVTITQCPAQGAN